VVTFRSFSATKRASLCSNAKFQAVTMGICVLIFAWRIAK
jgi:hypothetical protein